MRNTFVYETKNIKSTYALKNTIIFRDYLNIRNENIDTQTSEK